MKIVEVKILGFPEVKVIRFGRFRDHRGYFTETYRKSDFEKLDCLKAVNFTQANESHSKKGVIRGLHFQWNPFMAKLVRTISGRMVDLFLDIRKGSPNFGKIGAYDMPSDSSKDFDEWIWVPVGFAHGNFFPEETTIEYFCTGEYSPDFEVGISPLTSDIDWSLCDKKLKEIFDGMVRSGALMSEKDRGGLSVSQWEKDSRAENFVYEKM